MAAKIVAIFFTPILSFYEANNAEFPRKKERKQTSPPPSCRHDLFRRPVIKTHLHNLVIVIIQHWCWRRSRSYSRSLALCAVITVHVVVRLPFTTVRLVLVLTQHRKGIGLALLNVLVDVVPLLAPGLHDFRLAEALLELLARTLDEGLGHLEALFLASAALGGELAAAPGFLGDAGGVAGGEDGGAGGFGGGFCGWEGDVFEGLVGVDGGGSCAAGGARAF